MIRTLFIIFLPFYIQAQFWPEEPYILDSIEITAFSGTRNNLRLLVLDELTTDIIDALNNTASSFLKDYGSGQLTSWSVRGGSASQNGIYWNGININSPMLGLLDLEQIGSQQYQEISYSRHGHNDDKFHIGGILNIGFQPEIVNNRVVGQMSYTTNGEKYPLLYISHNKGNYIGDGQISFKKSSNQFDFIGRKKEATQAAHAAYQEWSVGHNSLFKIDEYQSIQGNVWLRGHDAEISPSLFQNSSLAWQQDHNYRFNIIYNNKRARWPIEVQGAYIHDRIRYANPEFDINDPAQSSSYITKIYSKFPLEKWNIKFGLEHNFSNVTSANYESKQLRHLSQLKIISEHEWNKFFSTKILTILSKNDEDILAPSISIQLNYNLGDFVTLYVHTGRAINIPTLNDLYWSPGGNVQLVPEKAWKTSFGARYNVSQNESTLYSSELNFFSNWIKDWILWQPLTGQIWSPTNVRSVWNRGVSADLKVTHIVSPSNKIWICSSTEYLRATYQNSIALNDNSSGNQLIYAPLWKSTFSFGGLFRDWQLTLNGVYSGSVFTTTDNSQSVKSYKILDANVNKSFRLGSLDISSSFSIKNLTNASYQVVLDRPMPLRYYSLQFKIAL